MEHTKGPWIAKGCLIGIQEDGRPKTIADANPVGFIEGTERKANAERIVACVNACEGISNERLEAGVVPVGAYDHAIAGLRAVIVALENHSPSFGKPVSEIETHIKECEEKTKHGKTDI